MRFPPARLLPLLLLLLPIGCDVVVADVRTPGADHRLPIGIYLAPNVSPADVRVAIDGIDVTASFAPGGVGLEGSVALPTPGPHDLSVLEPQALLGGGFLLFTLHRPFVVPAAAPALVSFQPQPVAGTIPRTAWLRFQFGSDLPPDALTGFGFALECGGLPVLRSAITVAGGALILNPQPELPAGASCRVVWRGPDGVAEQAFTVAANASGPAASVVYDRNNAFSLAPFPDDFYSIADSSTTTGRRLAFTGPQFGDLRDAVLGGIGESLKPFDGWSPIGPIVLAFSHAMDRTALPADEAASEDPFAAIALIDMDPASPDFGARIPYTPEVRNDLAPDHTTDHLVVLYPSITLRPGGQYALILTRRLVANAEPGRPFGPSPFFTAVTGAPIPGESDAVTKMRAFVAPVLDFVSSVPAVPIPREDVALALHLTMRSTLRDPADLIAMKENALAAPPPPLTITSTQTTAARRLIVRGTLALPDYLSQADFGVLTRNPATGRPAPWRTEAVPFVMSLPQQSLAGSVPVVIYQHGSPGSPEELLGSNNEFLDDAGYALVGIQDVSNRRYGADSTAQTAAQLVSLITNKHLPLVELQTHADMQSLVRAVQGLASRDFLPEGAPDGKPELDASKLLFRGISFGSHHSLGFLPFAPEVTAAVSVVGAGRFYENTIHQIDFFGIIGQIQALIPALRPVELVVGLAAIQNDEDRQDPHLLARYLYRERLPIAGLSPLLPPPSLLWLEGIGDDLVSNNATRAAARELGIPQVRRVRRVTPVLSQVDAPLAGNIGPTRTAGHFQYEPTATPSCVNVFHQLEAHYCTQAALEARTQILHFFQMALAGQAPEIIDPLP